MSSYILNLGTNAAQSNQFNPFSIMGETASDATSHTMDDDFDDDFDAYRARESAGQLQADYLAWQNGTQEKKGKNATNTAKEYDVWEKDERSTLSKDMSDNERKHFNRFADEYDSVHRPWAKQYEAEQRKTYGIDTQNGILANNKAVLAANLHNDAFVADSVGQIIAASNELAHLQNLGEKESAELRVNNASDAIKAALQGRLNADNIDDASQLYKRHGHLLHAANQAEMRENIMALHGRAQTKKAINGASDKLLHMDEEVAAAHLADVAWLQSMNISEAMLPELAEYSAVQRQSMQREKKKALDKQEFEWIERVLVANQTDPAAALRIVQEHKDLEPELRHGMIDAISKGRVDVADDTSTMLAFQDRMFGGEAQVASNDFAKEISKGNLRIETSKELLTMQHHMNKGEKKLVNNALSVLDASFHGVEDFAENPSRLAARNFYLRSLTKAIRENDMQQLITLTNKEHVQAVGNSFSGGSLGMSHGGEQKNENKRDIVQVVQRAYRSLFGDKVSDKQTPSSSSIHKSAHEPQGEPVNFPSRFIKPPSADILMKKYPLDEKYPKYTDEAFSKVQKAKGDILAAANAFGVPAMSIAGAIVDEYSAQQVWTRGGGSVDLVQDWYVKGASLENVRKNYAAAEEGSGIWSPHSAKHDVGPGNFGIRTALELFEKNIVQDKNDNPIKSFLFAQNPDLASASEQKKWEAYIDNMLLTTRGTAWLAAAEMHKGKEALEKAGALTGLSTKEKEAVIMTWYKQGQSYLNRYNSRPTTEKRPIGVGEGRGLFHYADTLEKILK